MPQWGISDFAAKQAAIEKHFAPHMGRVLLRYETAEFLHDDREWVAFPDLPIRLVTTAGLAAVSWSHSDDLWLASDESLPFAYEESVVRWVSDTIEPANRAIGGELRSVMLGRNEMTLRGYMETIWNRLAIEIGDGWLEIFNALDENGYAYHAAPPLGEFIRCV